jgi:Carbohydrate esterase, sialic acid-specific acetylesterase
VNVHKFSLVLFPALIAAAVAWFLVWPQFQGGKDALAGRLKQIVRVDHEPEVSCAQAVGSQPLVLLALGQSNAGNHGVGGTNAASPVTLFADGKCVLAVDPIPGGTGSGGSIWSRLPRHLMANGYSTPVVLSVLAVDATSLVDWSANRSDLHKRLVLHLASMRAQGLPPTVVLWQQGEADARRSTTEESYVNGMQQLVQSVGLNPTTRWILARSTVCRSAPYEPVRNAIVKLATTMPQFREGPDTDQLLGPMWRSDGCHFSEQGLDRAAAMWAQAIARAK